MMAWVLGSLLAVLVLATAVLAGMLVHLRRTRPVKDLAWSGDVATRMGAAGDDAFRVDGEGHVRGLLHGRPTVVGRTADRRTVVIMRLTMPLGDPDAPERPSLRQLGGDEGHRFGRQWVQRWSRSATPADVPALAAETMGLARAAEAQAAAPWAMFAGQHGLAFHAGRDDRPCYIQGELHGVPVRVQLDGLREPPLRTLIVAGRRRIQRLQGSFGGAAVLSGVADMGALLSRYDDAEIDENTVKIAIPGMVVDDLDARLHDAVALARALGRGAWS